MKTKQTKVARITRTVCAACTVGVFGLFSTLPASAAGEIKIGLALGFTGPVESMSPGMAESAELAIREASESGRLLNGAKAVPVRADSTCLDTNLAVAAAERLVTVERVAAIMGALCSSASIAIANNVAVPNGVVMVSPSSTSPALTTIRDNGFFHRTAPSDLRQGEVLAAILKDKKIKKVAVTYTNNDYGKGLAEAFITAHTAAGGKVTINAAHEEGKGDYSAEVGTLAAAGGTHLAVFGYLDGAGVHIVQGALDADSFDGLVFADGMIGDTLVNAIGKGLNGSIGSVPGDSSDRFVKYAAKNGIIDAPFFGQSYDAAALIMLAMQAAGSSDRAAIRAQMMKVANAPGRKIRAGDLAKGLRILAKGGDVDYVGATNVEFNKVGEVFGSYKEVIFKRGKFRTVRLR